MKKICCHTFFLAQISQNLKLFIFEMVKKKIWANIQNIIELFTQKIDPMLSKVRVWDPGSGKNLFRIQGSKRHRIPDPEHCTDVRKLSRGGSTEYHASPPSIKFHSATSQAARRRAAPHHFVTTKPVPRKRAKYPPLYSATLFGRFRLVGDSGSSVTEVKYGVRYPKFI